MAVIPKTDMPSNTWGDNCQYVRWTPLTQTGSDTGQPFECPGASDRSVQVTGTLGSGGVVRIEGSNLAQPTANAADWFPLTDPQGNALDINAVGRGEAISEVTRWIRPRVTAGDAATSFTVDLLARRS